MWRRWFGAPSCACKQLWQLTLVPERALALFPTATRGVSVASSGNWTEACMQRHKILKRQQRPNHALFRRILSELHAAANPTGGTNGIGAYDAAIPVEEPLTADLAQLEQLGVTDIMKGLTEDKEHSWTPACPSVDISSLMQSSIFTEACKAGVACQIRPVSVLKRVLAALGEKGIGPERHISSAALAVLYRAAATRVMSRILTLQRRMEDAVTSRKTPKDENKRPQSSVWGVHGDQGEIAWLRWELAEERRRSYELLCATRNVNCAADDSLAHQQFDKYRAMTCLAAALQDPTLLRESLEETVAFHSRQLEKWASLRLLTVLAHCVDTDPEHFVFVQNTVLSFFLRTDVGYLSETVAVSRDALCAVLRALSRVALDSCTKMTMAQSFYCQVQQSSCAEVCDSPSVVSALLLLASSARDGDAALLTYNQLAAPSVRAAESAENIAALMIAERKALHDAARFFSLAQLSRLTIVSTAVHLLAAKLLLQECDSEVIYTALDLINRQHEVDPQCTFFLRLLVLQRDMQITMKRAELRDDRVCAHAQRVIEEWCAKLGAAGISTLSLTTLQLIGQLWKELKTVADHSSGDEQGASISSGEELARLLGFMENLLAAFSTGWLRHRAVVGRTPRYHLTVNQLRNWMRNGDNIALAKGATQTAHHSRFAACINFEVSSLGAERCCELVEEAFQTLSTAASALCAEDNGKCAVVLSFSDYVQLCLLEEAGATARTLNSGASQQTFRFDLETLNCCEPLIYVTDAQGELLLQNDGEAANVAVQRRIEIKALGAVPFSVELGDNVVVKWLSRWLAESRALSSNVQGVFERQLEMLLRSEIAAEDSALVGGSDNNGSESEGATLPCFVSIDTSEAS
uniref:RAP domain-containing protein n=1 Tax=Trypanosoma vivax (strain Y486) TaxID=1055687 RepID=G0TRN9_TRYVY|nr:conserved hypothetical protein, fragment [Trypanosoma vivax Y486]